MVSQEPVFLVLVAFVVVGEMNAALDCCGWGSNLMRLCLLSHY